VEAAVWTFIKIIVFLILVVVFAFVLD